MRFASFLATLGLVLVAHVGGVRLSPVFPRIVDLFLIWTVLKALDGRSLPAMFRGTLAGLLYDTLSAGPFGTFGFADTIVGYGTARLAQRLVVQRGSGVFLVATVAVVLQQLAIAALALLLFPQPSLPEPLWVLARAGVCGALGAGLYGFNGAWGRWRAARRRQRTKRLRIEVR